MNDVLKLWVEDLRSGGWTQGTGALNRCSLGVDGKRRFCCLGRLCELAVEAHITERVAAQGFHDTGYTGTPSGDDYDMYGMPPREVLDWAGLTLEDALRYADMNDNHSSFREIAAEIERDFA